MFVDKWQRGLRFNPSGIDTILRTRKNIQRTKEKGVPLNKVVIHGSQLSNEDDQGTEGPTFSAEWKWYSGDRYRSLSHRYGRDKIKMKGNKVRRN